MNLTKALASSMLDTIADSLIDAEENFANAAAVSDGEAYDYYNGLAERYGLLADKVNARMILDDNDLGYLESALESSEANCVDLDLDAATEYYEARMMVRAVAIGG